MWLRFQAAWFRPNNHVNRLQFGEPLTCFDRRPRVNYVHFAIDFGEDSHAGLCLRLRSVSGASLWKLFFFFRARVDYGSNQNEGMR